MLSLGLGLDLLGDLCPTMLFITTITSSHDQNFGHFLSYHDQSIDIFLQLKDMSLSHESEGFHRKKMLLDGKGC